MPIKIGRGGGRIPEEDILRGLQWLLDNDNWQRYGVRVVNISVGGDFPQDWHLNPVCRAAHSLSQRGVVVVAAAGNRGIEELVAPAQTPTVITVGGVDDHNRRWRASQRAQIELLSLYHHNFGVVEWRHAPIRKPELLALARWLPSPVLPPTSVFRETYTIDRLRRVLHDDEDGARGGILAYWEELHRRLHSPIVSAVTSPETARVEWMPEVWHALRRRMNAHKWVHPYYQHVDGTSVAVAQVAAVAAQMVHANPNLDSAEVRRLLIDTSLPLPHLVARQTGAGLIQPASAVAAALRTHAGRLAGRPQSGTRVCINLNCKNGWNGVN
ncbi:MAG: S8 family serine peptidase [Anaerolineales bacterium]|nr:S8 family serine peptidase [Anaerolineales bacterium]